MVKRHQSSDRQQPAAQAVPSLVINELSSTTLTYSWTGANPQSGTVTATSPDYWQFNISDAIVTGFTCVTAVHSASPSLQKAQSKGCAFCRSW